MKGYATGFEHEQVTDLSCDSLRVVVANQHVACKHAFAPSISKHSSGQLLLACRWDSRGRAEGDDSNEQALFFSKDDGVSWTMANGDKPIITLANGTSFNRASSITHSFVFEEDKQRTWMYYTINQPYTWGSGKPDRSTGGGEIRKIQIEYQGSTWQAVGDSEIVWGFMQSLDDGQGGQWTNVRTVCLNGIIRTSKGTLLMPIAGRTTVHDPVGAFWKLNRVWVLESTDNGATWERSYYIGGNDSLCLCEPTLIETAAGRLICYMRVQYDTGNQLYRSESDDDGHTWSNPYPAGLPNTGTSGTKPYITKLSGNDYLLLQTNEHDTSSRTNISVFRTDEHGIQRNDWPLVKVLNTECNTHWEGVCYGWLEAGSASAFYATYVSFSGDSGYIHFAKLDLAWLESTVIEPNAGLYGGDNYLPIISANRAHSGTKSMRFTSTAGRLFATRFAQLAGIYERSMVIRMHVYVSELPVHSDFAFIHLSSRKGSQPAAALLLRPSANERLWIAASGGLIDTGILCPLEQWFELSCRINRDLSVSVTVNGKLAAADSALFIQSSEVPDTWKIGSTDGYTHDPCDIYIDDIYYGADAYS